MVKLEKESSLGNLLKNVLGVWGQSLDLGTTAQLPGTQLPPLSYVEALDEKGHFQLSNIPPGSYRLLATIKSVPIDGNETQWLYGAKVEAITVPADKPVDLGAIEIVVSEVEAE